MCPRFISERSSEQDGYVNLEATEVPSISGDNDFSSEVHPSSSEIVEFLLGAITGVNQLARHISILAKTMPSRDSVKVLVGLFVGFIYDLLKVRFPCYAPAVVEDLKVTIEGGIQDGEILVNPRERFVGKGDVESGAAGLRSSCRVNRSPGGWCDSQMLLDGLENTDSGIVVCLGPSQMRFGSVLPREFDGACSIRYSPVEQRGVQDK